MTLLLSGAVGIVVSSFIHVFFTNVYSFNIFQREFHNVMNDFVARRISVKFHCIFNAVIISMASGLLLNKKKV